MLMQQFELLELIKNAFYTLEKHFFILSYYRFNTVLDVSAYCIVLLQYCITMHIITLLIFVITMTMTMTMTMRYIYLNPTLYIQ